MNSFVRYFAIFLLLFSFPLNSKEPKKNEVQASKKPTIDFNNIELRLLGPAVFGGRISDLAINPNNKKEFYVAVASGGVWKTTNGGQTWATTTDEFAALGIADIVINPLNPDVIYVATGDGDATD
ncbi:MAG: glycosyl hydrolase, partial [Candidatus Kapaibacteriota bacterium]